MIKVETLSLLLNREVPTVPSLWGDALVPMRGITMLHSAAKQGKSMLTLNLALALAADKPEFLGIPLHRGEHSVLIYQGEIHERGVFDRASAMVSHMRASGDFTDTQLSRILVNETRDVRLDDLTAFNEFVKFVRWMRPTLVILDPVSHVLTENENDNAIVGRMFKRLSTMVDDPGCAIVLVHHDSKPSEASIHRRALQRTRGADVLSAAPDSVLSLVPLGKDSGGGPKSRLEFDGRYGPSIEPTTIILNERTLWFERCAPGRGEPQGVVQILQGMGSSSTVLNLAQVICEKWGYETKRMRVARLLITKCLELKLLVANGGDGDARTLTLNPEGEHGTIHAAVAQETVEGGEVS